MDLREIEIETRVRYSETDQMGVVHHSNYLKYFEIARTEHFRKWGLPSDEFEESGTLLMITDVRFKCRHPARFDDELLVQARVAEMTRYRIHHEYKIQLKNGRKIAIGQTAMAAVSKEGYPTRLPEKLWNMRSFILS